MGTLAFLNPAAQFVLAGHSSSGKGVADAALKHLNAQIEEQNRIRELLLFDPHITEPNSSLYPPFGTGIVDQAGYQLDENTPPEVLLAQNMEISLFGSRWRYGTDSGVDVYRVDLWGEPTRLSIQDGADRHRGIVSGMLPEAVETVVADALVQEPPQPITPIPPTPTLGATPSPAGPTPAQPGAVPLGTPVLVPYPATVANHSDIVDNGGLTLRNAAAPGASAIALLATGTNVEVLGINGAWLYVRVLDGPNAGEVGWVFYSAEQRYLDGLPF